MSNEKNEVKCGANITRRKNVKVENLDVIFCVESRRSAEVAAQITTELCRRKTSLLFKHVLSWEQGREIITIGRKLKTLLEHQMQIFFFFLEGAS